MCKIISAYYLNQYLPLWPLHTWILVTPARLPARSSDQGTTATTRARSAVLRRLPFAPATCGRSPTWERHWKKSSRCCGSPRSCAMPAGQLSRQNIPSTPQTRVQSRSCRIRIDLLPLPQSAQQKRSSGTSKSCTVSRCLRGPSTRGLRFTRPVSSRPRRSLTLRLPHPRPSTPPSTARS